ncbi:hypothetical protein ACPOL_0641 [Acidisarcina polymorpha]|uniref:Uncharacterized protein n=1 Tax=Acidisarcina polymorpha TaxID=2211140 RepID=A0A2Z5FT65_9BACT|nr:hypothetical protein ACPOL_0641 [Acidisarcina polymorpha]
MWVLSDQLSLDPLVNRGRPESPQFAHVHPCDFASQNHPLQRSGMNTEQGGCGVTIE